jgi:hypothetical protein
VNCREIDDMVIPYIQGKPIPPEAAAHIAECERCRRLAEAMRQAPQVDELPRKHLKRIEDRILDDLKPVKPLPATAVLNLVLLSIFAIVVVIGNVILGTAGWHALNLIQSLAVFSALAVSAGLLAFSAVRQIVPGSRLPLPPYLLVTAVLGVNGWHLQHVISSTPGINLYFDGFIMSRNRTGMCHSGSSPVVACAASRRNPQPYVDWRNRGRAGRFERAHRAGGLLPEFE